MEKQENIFNDLLSSYFEGASMPSQALAIAETMVTSFPYCQAAHFMYAACLKDKEKRIASVLPKVAVYAPERAVLFDCIWQPQKLKLKRNVAATSVIKNREANLQESFLWSEIAGRDQFKSSSFETMKTTFDPKQEPYSFSWWLKQFQQDQIVNYQPYIQNERIDASEAPTQVLNYHIVENILQTHSPLAHMESHGEEPDGRESREKEIINQFIQAEPQIKSLSIEAGSTENKARSSSEDTHSLVSETLAAIYTDQMLFHKAIDVYKKLSLKFPDRKLYFAKRIHLLEDKINN